MATAATTTVGLKLQRSTDGGTNYTTIAEVTNVAGPNESAAQIDVSSFDSTAHEFISALADSGEITFDMNFVGSNAQQQGLRTDLRAGTSRKYRVIVKDSTSGVDTDSTNVVFDGILTALSGPKGGVDQAVTQSCTIKVSGTPTWDYKV